MSWSVRYNPALQGGALTALQDWINRSTASGVIQAIRFDQSSAVTNWTHSDGSTSLVTRNATGGIIGDGSLKIDQPNTLNGNGGQWRIPLDSSWTGGGGQSQGMGTSQDIYIQFRVKYGTNWLTPSTGGGGKKTCIVGGYTFNSPNSSSSDIDSEFVITNENNRGYPWFYHHATGQSVDRSEEWEPSGVPGYPFGHYIQPEVDHGSGFADSADRYSIYENGGTPVSPGVILNVEGVWWTFLIRLNIVSFTEDNVFKAGNIAELDYAPAGATAYTALSHRHGFAQSSSDIGGTHDASNGPQALWLLPYDTGRTGSATSFSVEYDQVIVSRNRPAVPVY